jgi:hypothetical protein
MLLPHVYKPVDKQAREIVTNFFSVHTRWIVLREVILAVVDGAAGVSTR